MKNEIDYTKMRVSKAKKLVRCPDCGKVGQLHKYVDNSAMIVHKSHIALGCFNHVDESCFFKQWNQVSQVTDSGLTSEARERETLGHEPERLD